LSLFYFAYQDSPDSRRVEILQSNRVFSENFGLIDTAVLTDEKFSQNKKAQYFSSDIFFERWTEEYAGRGKVWSMGPGE